MTVLMESDSLTVYAEKCRPYFSNMSGSALIEQPSICGFSWTIRLVYPSID